VMDVNLFVLFHQPKRHVMWFNFEDTIKKAWSGSLHSHAFLFRLMFISFSSLFTYLFHFHFSFCVYSCLYFVVFLFIYFC
jgi:hypothetical protein